MVEQSASDSTGAGAAPSRASSARTSSSRASRSRSSAGSPRSGAHEAGKGEHASTKDAAKADGAGALTCNIPFCPICTAVLAGQKGGPEAIGHLFTAARELLLAARAVVDMRTPDVPENKGSKQRVQRIEIK
jgi:hypothetical protein